jgi:hypothetical protein
VRSSSICWTLLGLIPASSLVAEQARILVWQVDLRNLLGSRSGELAPDAPIHALRFSPDGRRIAVVVGGNGFVRREGPRDTDRLIILNVDDPDRTVAPFAVNHGVDDNDGPSIFAFGWSPSSSLINVGGTLVDTRSAQSCTLPSDGLLIAHDRVIGPFSIGEWSSDPAHFHIYDSHCDEVGDWSLPESWSLQRVSSDGREVSIQKWTGGGPVSFRAPPPRVPVSVADPDQKRILQHWENADWFDYQFIDRGKEICSGDIPETLKSNDPLECWSVATGKVVAKAGHIRGGAPLQTSADSTKVASTDYAVLMAPWNEDGVEVRLKRRVIWDFRTGTEVTSWKPPIQKYISRYAVAKPTEDAFRFALSADGNLIAEGGNGVVRLYRIQP